MCYTAQTSINAWVINLVSSIGGSIRVMGYYGGGGVLL